MNKCNTSLKITFMVLIEGRYLAGFRMLRRGFDYGLTDNKTEALEFNSRSDASSALEMLSLVSKEKGLVVPSSWARI